MHEHLSGEGASNRNEQVALTEEGLGAFTTHMKAYLKAPVLAFANFDKPFLLETDARKPGLGAVISPKQTYGCHHVVVYEC